MSNKHDLDEKSEETGFGQPRKVKTSGVTKVNTFRDASHVADDNSNNMLMNS